MKKHILYTFLFLFPISTSSQVGNVGIDTTNPQEKLHVKGSIRYESTSPSYLPANGKTLVSDASGNATWQMIDLSKPSISAVFNKVPYNKVNSFAAYPYTVSSTPYRTTGTTLTLPKGKWLVVVSLGVYVDNKLSTESTYYPMKDGRDAWVKATFFTDNTDNTTANPPADILSPGVYSSAAIVGPNPSGLITGEFFIDQASATPVTYYLKYKFEYFSPQASDVRISNFGVSQETIPENFIIAYPINF